MKIQFLLFGALFILAGACSKEEQPNPPGKELINAADISFLPEIEATGTKFFNADGNQEDVLLTLKKNGVNTIRLRLWHNPVSIHSSFQEVKSFAERIKQQGLKVWLSVHYSDTWADPGAQSPPTLWNNLSFDTLKDSVYNYTKKIITEIDPDYIQIGNEINSGILLPAGDISNNPSQFTELLSTGIKAVRDHSTKAKIIIHFAGLDGADWFFNHVKDLNYDIIGLSYYPLWHGHNLNTLKTTFSNLGQTYGKDIVIAETAYPFTLEWDDNTNNVLGQESQLILPDYPATPEGQKNFLKEIYSIVKSSDKGIGLSYWGAEWIAFKGPQATDGSPWENQALYNYSNRALPAMEVFKN
jgi:arabinogalactan endo-1,4-beta-galactosidase